MDHNDVRHKLSEYIDDAVTPDERAAIDAHIATCSTCADALREIRKTIEHLRSVPEVEPPTWMTSKIMAKVREEAEKKSILQLIFGRFVLGRAVRVAALLFLTVGAYYIYTGVHYRERYFEAPTDGRAKKEAPIAATEAMKRKAPEPALPEAKTPRSPGYKALDMKDEYERPAPPEPAAPRETGNLSLRNAAPAPMAEQATGAARSFEKKSALREEGQVAGTAPLARDRLLPQEKQQSDKGITDDARRTMDVTAYFWEHDLRQDMKVRGLQYTTRRIPDDLLGLEWLSQMRSYQKTSCSDRYIVEVELSGTSSKYLYCHDNSRVRLIGIYDLVSGVWMERK